MQQINVFFQWQKYCKIISNLGKNYNQMRTCWESMQDVCQGKIRERNSCISNTLISIKDFEDIYLYEFKFTNKERLAMKLY